MQFAMSASASHHQKSVLVDYELSSAVGFVMGHNSLDVQTAPFSQRHSGMDSKEATVRMSVPPLGDGAAHRLAGIAATTALVLETNNLRGGSDAVQALGSLKRLVARYAQQSV